jgi:hypothetical protein
MVFRHHLIQNRLEAFLSRDAQEFPFWGCQPGQFPMDQAPALVVSIYVGC